MRRLYRIKKQEIKGHGSRCDEIKSQQVEVEKAIKQEWFGSLVAMNQMMRG